MQNELTDDRYWKGVLLGQQKNISSMINDFEDWGELISPFQEEFKKIQNMVFHNDNWREQRPEICNEISVLENKTLLLRPILLGTLPYEQKLYYINKVKECQTISDTEEIASQIIKSYEELEKNNLQIARKYATNLTTDARNLALNMILPLLEIPGRNILNKMFQLQNPLTFAKNKISEALPDCTKIMEEYYSLLEKRDKLQEDPDSYVPSFDQSTAYEQIL